MNKIQPRNTKKVHNKNLLLIFTRNPELGKVKSRLAKDIGDRSALEIYKILLGHTVTVTQQLPVSKSVWYSERIVINDIWDSASYEKHLQNGVDLGDRMKNAFEFAFKEGFSKVVIIGSDVYDISDQHIREAFSKLDTYDAVLGPAKDGGYYLLGLKSMVPSLFIDKNWGSSTVLDDTINVLKNYDTYFLEVLNDIDYVRDLEGYPIFEKFFAQKR